MKDLLAKISKAQVLVREVTEELDRLARTEVNVPLGWDIWKRTWYKTTSNLRVLVDNINYYTRQLELSVYKKEKQRDTQT